jgi:hypothetical protein
MYVRAQPPRVPHRCGAPSPNLNAKISSWRDGYFQGQLDDIRIYNRALTATEVKQLYNAGR